MTPLATLTRSFLDIFQLPDPITVSQWADRYRYLSSESSSRLGKWTTLAVQREPMDAVLDPDVESVCLMWASQTAGKTEIINNIVGYFIDQDPAPMLVLQPTVEMAQAWNKDRVAPMIRDTPRLTGRVRDPKSRDSGNTILHKTFPGGHMTTVGANAPSALAMRPVRVVICDEVDRYPASAGGEGDPIALAEKRSDTFWDAVLFKTSTPTVRGLSRIEAEFELTDKRYWFVPCHACGMEQVLNWAQVSWDKGDPASAVYVCEGCKVQWTDAQRVAAIERGKWKATATGTAGKRGYHLSGLYTTFRSKKGYQHRLHQMVAQFLEAKAKGQESLRVWTNTFLAETFEEAGEVIEAAPLMNRAETYGPAVPNGVLVLTAGADIQQDRIECEIVGWGKGEESWGIRVARFLGGPDIHPEVWDQLNDFLSQKFTTADGRVLTVARLCIDSGKWPRLVYDFAKRKGWPFVMPVKGASDPTAPIYSYPRSKGSKQRKVVTVGTVAAKNHLFSRMKLTEPGARFMHFPQGYGYDEEWFEQLVSEKRVSTFHRGRPVVTYKQIRSRNEALDMRVYSLAALDSLNVDWEALTARAERTTKTLATEPKAPDKVPSSPAATKATPAPRLRSGWVKRW